MWSELQFDWMWLFWAAVMLVVVWVMLHMFRSAVSRQAPETPEEFLERRRAEGEAERGELEKEWDELQK